MNKEKKKKFKILQIPKTKKNASRLSTCWILNVSPKFFLPFLLDIFVLDLIEMNKNKNVEILFALIRLWFCLSPSAQLKISNEIKTKLKNWNAILRFFIKI